MYRKFMRSSICSGDMDCAVSAVFFLSTPISFLEGKNAFVKCNRTSAECSHRVRPFLRVKQLERCFQELLHVYVGVAVTRCVPVI
jgi:hypothetical protein